MSSNEKRSADEAALRDLIQPIVNGWNRGEGEIFAFPFTEDADYIAAPGVYIKGQQEIASGHQRIFETIYRGSQLEAEIASIRFLSPDIALMRLDFHLQKIPGGSEHRTRATLIALRQAKGWGITSFHNTQIQHGPGQ